MSLPVWVLPFLAVNSSSENRRHLGWRQVKMISHLLFETASGYGIFEAKLHEDIGSRSQAVQDSIKDLAKFGKMVSLISFSPFKNAAEALQNANDISEGQQGAISCWVSN
jgi:NOP5NT (NUC127) domain